MYGVLPKVVGFRCDDFLYKGEYLYYQYMPIKLSYPENTNYYDVINFSIEDRLIPFYGILSDICYDFQSWFGHDRYKESYIYLTLKRQYQKHDCGFNRAGWHSDGFMSDDVNYIWYSKQPTIFNYSKFNLTQDHEISLQEMNEQALWYNNYTFPNNSILRLDQYNIHKVGPIEEGVRTFLKVTFSKEKFNLEGNTHNYLLNYNWDMKPRKKSRNIPYSL